MPHTFTQIIAIALLSACSMIASAADAEWSITRGGRLYDKWFGEMKKPEPTTDHPAYPNAGSKYGKHTSWRCKECHGWDYRGKDGAYAKGGHATGIKGIQGAAGRDPAEIAAILRDKNHAYTETQLSARDLADLALFVAKGQIDMTRYVENSKSKGDAVKGETYFNTVCAGCHGMDGKRVTDAPPLGSVADNAYEMMHKILNGQPAEAMPALRVLDHQIAADIAAYLVKLPKE